MTHGPRPRRRVLVVGSGAREHALAWRLSASAEVRSVLIAPGNAGTAQVGENVPVASTDIPGLVRLVEERDIALTIVGPEAPLTLGLADALRQRGRAVVGPSAAAARLESSKAFAKELMVRAGVPTAGYRVFDGAEDALRHIDGFDGPVVVKADGLAAGKGVEVCETPDEARRAVRRIMLDRVHGEAGRRVVIEERLTGPEVSLLALVDGRRAVALPTARDHKRLCDGDTGPNTGGMGAYAPAGFLDTRDRDRLVATVINPVVAALAETDAPFRGVLFAGLILTDSGPQVLEYNCRFGDPEAQVVLPLLDEDFYPRMQEVAVGDLSGTPDISDRTALGVVLAAPGYPEQPRLNDAIAGLDAVPDDVLVFHAGTRRDVRGRVVTAGGRVLTVVGLGDDLDSAARRAYDASVHFSGMQRRTDIGRRSSAEASA